jgi:hypothetical protein
MIPLSQLDYFFICQIIRVIISFTWQVAPLTSSEQVTCPICSRTFSRQSVLNVHTQMVHTSSSPISKNPKTKSHFDIATNVDGSVEDFLDGESLIDDSE